jgi:uncharacterized protein YbjQ (UPF0145 family)
MADMEVRACIRTGCAMQGVRTEDVTCATCGMPTRTGGMAASAISQRDNPATHELPGQPATLRLLMVTANDVAGYRIVRVHGDVFGTTVRARDYFSNLGARFRTLVGGEVVGYTKLLTQTRHEARHRLQAEAARIGANAVIAMRFDCNEIGDIMSEVTAYGTAVTVERIEG